MKRLTLPGLLVGACAQHGATSPPPFVAPAAVEAAQVPPAPPPSTSVAGDRATPVLDVAVSPDGATLAVLRAGTLELMDTRTGRVLRSRSVLPSKAGVEGRSPLRFSSDGRVLESEYGAFSTEALEPAARPVVPAGRVVQRDAKTVALHGLDGTTCGRLSPALRRHQMRCAGDGAWTVFTSLVDQERFGASPEGRFLFRESGYGADLELVRIDNGAHASFRPWTRGQGGMGQPISGWASVVFGPSVDRVVVQSTSSQGANYEYTEARLVDTSTMKLAGVLHTDCQPSPTVWSPGASWVVRRDCATGAMMLHDGRDGRLVRSDTRLVARSFSRDEQKMAALTPEGAVVLDVEHGARKLVVRGGARTNHWLRFTPDGSALIAAQGSRFSRWNLRTGAHAAIETRWPAPERAHVDASTSFAWTEALEGGSEIVDLAAATARRLGGWARAVTPDGFVASVHDRRVDVVGPDGTLRGSSKTSERAERVALSSGGLWLAVTADTDARVEIFDAANGRRVGVVATPSTKAALLETYHLPGQRVTVPVGRDKTNDLAFRPGADEVALIQQAWGGACSLTIAPAAAPTRVRTRSLTSCPQNLAWTRDGAHVLVGTGAQLEAHAADLASEPRVVAKTNAFQYEGPLQRLAAATASLDDLERALAARPGEPSDSKGIVVDAEGRFTARFEGDSVVLVRVADGSRLRLFSGPVLAHEGAIAIGPEGTFDTTSPSLEEALEERGVRLTEAQLASRRRPGLLQSFVRAAW